MSRIHCSLPFTMTTKVSRIAMMGSVAVVVWGGGGGYFKAAKMISFEFS